MLGSVIGLQAALQLSLMHLSEFTNVNSRSVFSFGGVTGVSPVREGNDRHGESLARVRGRLSPFDVCKLFVYFRSGAESSDFCDGRQNLPLKGRFGCVKISDGYCLVCKNYLF